MKFGVFLSHPVYYQTPIYQELSKEPGVALRVYFYSDFGAKQYFDPQFQQNVKWDLPLLEGYAHEFPKNYSPFTGFGFLSFINPSAGQKILREKFDAILISSWSYMTDWIAIFAALITGTKILLRTESPLNQELLKPSWKRLFKKILFGKFLFPSIHAFLYIGEENKRFYQYYDVPESKLFFAPYAVDNERFMKAAEDLRFKKKDLRKELDIGEKDIVILFVGKLSEKKRPFDLLKAYEFLIHDSRFMLHLVFVGDGELRNSLEKYTKQHKIPNVIFTGFKNRSEIAQYYAVADIFVLPSGIGETWGLVVNEAMCFGLPIIASAMAGCVADLVRPGANGYTFSCGDIKSLNQYLKNLIENETERINFGTVSLSMIQKYAYPKIIASIKQTLIP